MRYHGLKIRGAFMLITLKDVFSSYGLRHVSVLCSGEVFICLLLVSNFSASLQGCLHICTDGGYLLSKVYFMLISYLSHTRRLFHSNEKKHKETKLPELVYR